MTAPPLGAAVMAGGASAASDVTEGAEESSGITVDMGVSGGLIQAWNPQYWHVPG